jgi:hypothetical protein
MVSCYLTILIGFITGDDVLTLPWRPRRRIEEILLAKEKALAFQRLRYRDGRPLETRILREKKCPLREIVRQVSACIHRSYSRGSS